MDIGGHATCHGLKTGLIELVEIFFQCGLYCGGGHARKRPRESVAGARVSLLREKDPFRIPTYEKLLHFPRSPPEASISMEAVNAEVEILLAPTT